MRDQKSGAGIGGGPPACPCAQPLARTTGLLLALASVLWLLAPAASGQTLTTIADTLKNADGANANGRMVITGDPFTQSGGTAVPALNLTYTITNGVVNLQIAANSTDGNEPFTTAYRVAYYLDAPGGSWRETWVVPETGGPYTIAQVRKTIVTTSGNLPLALGAMIIQDEGVDLAQRYRLNFTGSGIACTASSTAANCAVSTSGISSLNGQTGATQTFSKTDDANVTLTIASAANNHGFTVGWTGLLGLNRGGTGADLSATGGAGQFVKQSTLGGALSVGTISDADVPDTITLSNITQITNRAITDTTGDLPASRVDDGGAASTQALFSGGAGAAGFRAIADGDLPASLTRDSEVPASGTTQTANTVFAGPASGAAAAPAFRVLVDDDVPNTITLDNLTQITNRAITDTTGTLPLNRGGTNQTAWTASRCVRVNDAGTALESASGDCGVGGGSGDNVSVNGAAASDADFDDTTPAAPANAINVRWQKDALSPNNISANLPYAAPLTVVTGNLTLNQNAGTDVTADLEEENHAAEHQHGGNDEIATATPGANAIPKAGAGGTLDDGWLSANVTKLGQSIQDAEVDDNITLTNITQITNRAITDTTGDLPASRIDDGGAASTQALFSGGAGAAGFRAIADGDLPASLTRDNEVPASGTTQTANTVFAGPASGAAAAPAFRVLVDDDVPNTITLDNLTQITNRAITDTTGTLPLNRGGTNQTAWTASRCVRVNDAGTALESASGDCGVGGGGDSISVNGSAATDANFINSGDITFSLNTTPSPDEISASFAADMATQSELDAHANATAAHGASGAVVGTTNSQTLTNKTLTTPIISGATVAGLPAAGGPGRVAIVTDGQSTSDCTVGGGSTWVWCMDNGAAWVPASVSIPVSATQGGTGQTTYALGDMLYSDAANSLAKLAGNTTTTKQFLTQTGDGVNSAAPAWGTIAAGDLGNDFVDAVTDLASGLCSGANKMLSKNAGGTAWECVDGLQAPAGNGMLAWDGTSLLNRTITGTSNEVTVSNGDGVSGNPTLSLASTFDISGKTSTKPVKTGTTAPGTCSVGELFFDTDSTAGQNIYACTATNTWTLQGDGGGGASLTVREEDGTPSVAGVTEIRVSNGTLSDNGSGSVSIQTGGGGATVIQRCVIDADTQSTIPLTDAQITGRCDIPASATLNEIAVYASGGTPSIILERWRPNGGATADLLSGALATGASGAYACARSSTGATCISGITSSGTITISNTALNAGDVIRVKSASAGGTATWFHIVAFYTLD